MSSQAAMFQHPIVAIQSGAINFSLKSKPINLKLLHEDYEIVKKKIESAVEKYTTYTNATIEQFKLQTDAKILKYQAEGKRDILMAALAPDFLQKYSSDLHYEDTYEKLLSYITDIFGSQSAAAKIEAAEDRMSSITRDSASNEKFARFLTRLERLSKIVSDKPDTQAYLINKHFRRALSPKLRTFLKEQRKISSNPTEIATFLDEMDKFKQPLEVCSVEVTETRNEIQALNAKFDRLFNEKFDQLQSEMREMMKVNFSHQTFDVPEVNAVMNKKTDKNSRKPPIRQTARGLPRSNWELDRWGKPVQCKKCGLNGHRTEVCRGTCRYQCHNCQEIGHLAHVCPKKEKTSSKN